jgi:hypothetical protein
MVFDLCSLLLMLLLTVILYIHHYHLVMLVLLMDDVDEMRLVDLLDKKETFVGKKRSCSIGGHTYQGLSNQRSSLLFMNTAARCISEQIK